VAAFIISGGRFGPEQVAGFIGIRTSFFFGITASAAVALIPLYQASMQVDGWVKPAIWFVGAISLGLGVLFQHFARKCEKLIEVNCESVKKDMKDIYSTFFPNKDIESEAG
jgi:hypothetical protein